jgi:hypothetical protein
VDVLPLANSLNVKKAPFLWRFFYYKLVNLIHNFNMHSHSPQIRLFNLEKLSKYGQANSYDLAKCIAITAMLIDHLGMFFFPNYTILRIIGRISFPIFFFLIGYSQKFKNEKPILLLALCMIGLDYILRDNTISFFFTNKSILPTIIISRFFLYWSINWVKNNLLVSFVILLLYYIPMAIIFEFGTLGCMFMIYGYLIRNNYHDLKSKVFICLTLVAYILNQGSSYNFAGIIMFILLMSALLIWMYNFKIRAYVITAHPINNLILLCSRYSLYIYCIHYELFKIISIVLFKPEILFYS